MAPTNPLPTSGDELDEILSGIAAEGGYGQSQTEPTTSRPAANNADGGLGIDEEIVVTKKRIPIPKLDDARLRSERGIPRLRKISKERLRFKGKGHEYGDIARLLNMYQLWLDDLYPRAKFADALAIIEKVGHTKRMQVDRKAWIDEGKPRRTTEEDDEDMDVAGSEGAAAQNRQEPTGNQETSVTTAERQSDVEISNQPNSESHATDEQPDEDELDALLAESGQPELSAPRALPSRSIPADNDPFADEMEAMEGMEDMW